jgi:glyoxylase-like metal-dependent hydrolase (beta-lactamase superfamily II)
VVPCCAMRWLTRLGLGAVALLAALWFGFFFLNGTPQRPYALDLGAVRTLADAPAQQLPQALRVERVAVGTLPRVFVVSGNGPLGNYPAVYASFQVLFPEGRSVIIDTAYDRAIWQRLDGLLSEFNDEAYARVKRAMAQATHIVVTHEHADHLAGLWGAHDDDTWARARLTPEQLAFAPSFGTGFTRDELARQQPLTFEGMTRLEPGVVLIRAPGHSPGSQLIYVKRADGRELLFVGDIAWNRDNLTRERARPLITSLYLKEDRDAVTAQLVRLHALQLEHPTLEVVVAHDALALDRLVQQGLIASGFEERP